MVFTYRLTSYCASSSIWADTPATFVALFLFHIIKQYACAVLLIVSSIALVAYQVIHIDDVAVSLLYYVAYSLTKSEICNFF